jgi:hypothetical protein
VRADELIPLFAECADRTEHLRQGGAEVVLVTGCELSLFGVGYLPGRTVFERIAGLSAGGPELHAAITALPGRLKDSSPRPPAPRAASSAVA